FDTLVEHRDPGLHVMLSEHSDDLAAMYRARHGTSCPVHCRLPPANYNYGGVPHAPKRLGLTLAVCAAELVLSSLSYMRHEADLAEISGIAVMILTLTLVTSLTIRGRHKVPKPSDAVTTFWLLFSVSRGAASYSDIANVQGEPDAATDSSTVRAPKYVKPTGFAPFLHRYLLAYIGDKKEYGWHGFAYAAAYGLSQFVGGVMNAHSAYFMSIGAFKVQSALTCALYKKVLRTSGGSLRQYTAGQIMNLMSIDVTQVGQFLMFVNNCWSVPLKIVAALAFLWHYLGPSCLALVVIMLSSILASTCIWHYCDKFQVINVRDPF
ncbi:hypothetical protein HPB47_022132, partial [Ixodes persulcatus]